MLKQISKLLFHEYLYLKLPSINNNSGETGGFLITCETMTRELRPKRFTLKLLLLWVSFIQVNILLPNIFEFFPIIIEA